ncbi:hypothetical protein [Nitratifractor sp.]
MRSRRFDRVKRNRKGTFARQQFFVREGAIEYLNLPCRFIPSYAVESARCVDARCEGVHSQNVGAPGGCVEALDVSPMPPMIDTDGVLANA